MGIYISCSGYVTRGVRGTMTRRPMRRCTDTSTVAVGASQWVSMDCGNLVQCREEWTFTRFAMVARQWLSLDRCILLHCGTIWPTRSVALVAGQWLSVGSTDLFLGGNEWVLKEECCLYDKYEVKKEYIVGLIVIVTLRSDLSLIHLSLFYNNSHISMLTVTSVLLE